jgi:hypothetical protein
MSIAVVDYGSGNLRSVAKALIRVAGEDVVVTSDPDEVRKAERIVLPGVGAFADCMKGLDALPGMHQVLQEQVIEAGRPFRRHAADGRMGPRTWRHQGSGLDQGRSRRFGTLRSLAKSAAYGLEPAYHSPASPAFDGNPRGIACLFRP